MKRQIWALCQDAAEGIYGSKAPNDRYADAVARMLMGTAAQESSLLWRRQRSCTWDGSVGGFSLWQVEWGSVQDSIKYLRSRPDVRSRATWWLWRDHNATDAWLDMDKDALLWILRGWDRAGALFARLHYLRRPEPIPDSLVAQAHYWLRYYNGGGVLKYKTQEQAIEQYTSNWYNLCASVVEGKAE